MEEYSFFRNQHQTSWECHKLVSRLRVKNKFRGRGLKITSTFLKSKKWSTTGIDLETSCAGSARFNLNAILKKFGLTQIRNHGTQAMSLVL